MARIEIRDHDLIVHVEGLDKVLALRSKITVPLAHVQGTVVRPPAITPRENPEFIGTYIPGKVVAGTGRFADYEGLVFCDVHDPSRALAIEIEHDRYQRVVVELSDETPESAAARIEAARSELMDAGPN
jgi:hypothetical protein